MQKIYRHAENSFEKLTSIVTSILGNSITFIIALGIVLFWWTNTIAVTKDSHIIIGDIIFGTTFLSLFIIQKSFNKFSASLHLKINELVSSNELANNAVLNAEIKTELEISALTKEYADLVEGNMKDNEDSAVPKV